MICRDRAGAYAEGARTGAPDAIQVADRWHLWHNLAEHVEKEVTRHRGCLKEPEPEPSADAETRAGPAASSPRQAATGRAEASALARRTRERYEQVQALRAQGKGIKPIMRELGLAKETVRRFYRASSVDELLAKTRGPASRPSWTSTSPTCTSGGTTAAPTSGSCTPEIRARGYRGGYGTVRDYLQPFRALAAAARRPGPAEGPRRHRMDAARPRLPR